MAWTDIFKELLTGDPLAGVAKIIDEFHLSPDEKAKLQAAAQELEIKRAEISANRDQALEQIAATDRANARQRQTAVHDTIPGSLAIAVTAGFFGLLYLLCFRATPASGQQVLYAMVGVLGTAWVTVITYYFGSSAGSARKDETMVRFREEIGKVASGQSAEGGRPPAGGEKQ